MAENISELSTPVLEQKIKSMSIIIGVMASFSIVIALATLYLAFVAKKSVTTLVILLPVIYLPVILMAGNRKKYREELDKRAKAKI